MKTPSKSSHTSESSGISGSGESSDTGALGEMIDLVDSRGRPTAVVQSRAEVHAGGGRHRTVHVWVLTPGGKVLLQQRALSKASHPGLWDVSCAGHIESGMTSSATAVKELFEELGVRAGEDELLHLGSAPSFFVLQEGAFIDNELVDVYLLKRTVRLKSLVLQRSEVVDARPVSPDRFRSMVEQRDPALVPHDQLYTFLLGYLDAVSL